MFWCARYASWFSRLSKPMWMMLSRRFFQGPLRAGPMANARRILGPDASEQACRELTDKVLENFYIFIHDVGRAGGMSRAQLEAQIGQVIGDDHFRAAHAKGKGVIIATAHLGSFEVGVAAAAGLGPPVHVVFQQDPLPAFNKLRHRLHARLAIREAWIEQGMSVWMELRDALARNELVLIQADRLMPGHRGLAVPFFDGHLMLPLGPIKLAAMTGAPIVPVFAPRGDDGKVQIVIEPAIEVDPTQVGPGMTDPPDALLALRSAIEKQVRRSPDQWLMLHRAWNEDQPHHDNAATTANRRSNRRP